jgi:SAM-dependent methyltransferase
MNRACDAFIATLNTTALSCIEISGDGSRWAKQAWAAYETTRYPDYDLCSSALPGQWDVVICEQVLEHVPDPEMAVKNIYTMLRDGGVAVVTTPFLVKFHAIPHDYSRWTPSGLSELLARAGFSTISVDCWGNRRCMLSDMTTDMQWTYYKPLIHSLRNDRRFPIMVWAFAHK